MQVQSYTTQFAPEALYTVGDGTRTVSTFNRVLRRYTPISLEQMHNAALLRRIDTKYVFSEAQLAEALSRLTTDYDVLDIKGQRLHHYQTLYFDLPDFTLYRHHHDGWRTRYKVRSRAYVDSGLAFLEVKQKTNKDVTIKHRLQTPFALTDMDADAAGFLRTCFPGDAEALEPKLGNSFRRITLVSKRGIERLTLDVNLSFEAGGASIALPGVAIAEVKQEAFSLRSEFVGQMRALGIRPMGFSKYCMGVALLYAQVKHNNFKPQWLYIDKLIREATVPWTIS